MKNVVRNILLQTKKRLPPPLIAMTSNTTPSPFVISASSFLIGFPAFHAYDNNPSNFWANDGDFAASITIDYGVQYTFSSVQITVRSDVTNQNPVNFTLESSNDGSAFTVFSTQTGVSWSPSFVRSFAFNPILARYMRINVSLSGGLYISINDIKWS